MYNETIMATVKAKKEEKIAVLTDAQENYVRMYHAYFVLHWNWPEICKFYKCSKATVSKAINWVIENKIKFPSKYLVEGAIESISRRLKVNQELLNSELNKTKNRDKRFIIELNREIREDERMLHKLMEIVDDGSDSEGAIKTSDVLKLINAAAREKETITT